MNNHLKKLFLIPHLKIQNANALSSPITIGFPAMTAWLGAVHALQRKLNSFGFSDVRFAATAVVAHHLDLQTYRGAGDFVSSIVGTGNPLDKNGSRPAFIEEARCHLDVTLLIELESLYKDDEDEFLENTATVLYSGMKLAGGDILSFDKLQITRVEDRVEKDLRRLGRRLMPGYVIVERRELMIEAMRQGQDAIDALLDYLAVHHSCEKDESQNITWISKRKAPGWIIPIATGFHGISDLGEAINQRDPDTPHRFAEAVVTLGEFKMPYQIQSVEEILWRYHFDNENNLYLCQQSNSNNQSI